AGPVAVLYGGGGGPNSAGRGGRTAHACAPAAQTHGAGMGPFCPGDDVLPARGICASPHASGAGDRGVRSAARSRLGLPPWAKPRCRMPLYDSRGLVATGLSGPGFAVEPAGTDPGPGASRPLYPSGYELLCGMAALWTAAGGRRAHTDGGCYDGGPGSWARTALARAVHDLTRLGAGRAGAEGRGARPHAARRGHLSGRGRRDASVMVWSAVRR